MQTARIGRYFLQPMAVPSLHLPYTNSCTPSIQVRYTFGTTSMNYRSCTEGVSYVYRVYTGDGTGKVRAWYGAGAAGGEAEDDRIL